MTRIIKINNATTQLTMLLYYYKETLLETVNDIEEGILLLICSELLVNNGSICNKQNEVEIKVDYGKKQSASYSFLVNPYTQYSLRTDVKFVIHRKRHAIETDFLCSLIEL